MSRQARSSLPFVYGCSFQRVGACLRKRSFAALRDQIRAEESELLWEDLPWLTSYHDGLQKAAEERRPLLLWVMNGHPLGCT